MVEKTFKFRHYSLVIVGINIPSLKISVGDIHIISKISTYGTNLVIRYVTTPTSSAMPRPTPRTSTDGSRGAREKSSSEVTDGSSKAEKFTVRQKLDEVTRPLRVRLFGRSSTSSGTSTKTTTPTTPTRTPTTPMQSTTTTTTQIGPSPTRTSTSPIGSTKTPIKTFSTSTRTYTTPTKTVTTSAKTSTTPTRTTTTTTRVTVYSSKDNTPSTRESLIKSPSDLQSSRDSFTGRYLPRTTTEAHSIIVHKGTDTYKTVRAVPTDISDKRILSKTPLTERSERNIMPRTPSEEVLQDSCYHTNISLSKSSSAASMTLDSDEYLLRRTPSREGMDLDSLSVGSGTSSSKGSEWYNEYKSQSFQNFNSKLERVLTRQEYDSHIAEIRGKIVHRMDIIISVRKLAIKVYCLLLV
ncbi:hypothetical protein RUM43_009827 [Polyplax serrata]|uniref:Uncharacterized protein n=1 Tax=Polyplax serrata TaxID=468196 RepID=A0AAN8S4H8_POLSC